MFEKKSLIIASLLLWCSSCLLCKQTEAMNHSNVENAMMPLNCHELLADPSPYLNFFASVGKELAQKDKAASRKVFRLLALREKVETKLDRDREQNPVDTAIKKTICFYREQKEPLKAINAADKDFLAFLIPAIKELETKVESAVYTVEYDRQARLEADRRARKNLGAVQRLEDEASIEAERTFEKISNAAKLKVKKLP